MPTPRSMIDCDSHFWQPFDVWERYVDPADKDVVATWLRGNDPMQTLDPPTNSGDSPGHTPRARAGSW